MAFAVGRITAAETWLVDDCLTKQWRRALLGCPEAKWPSDDGLVHMFPRYPVGFIWCCGFKTASSATAGDGIDDESEQES